MLRDGKGNIRRERQGEDEGVGNGADERRTKESKKKNTGERRGIEKGVGEERESGK